MKVKLRHRLNAMRAYNLTHEHYCAALGRCVCRPIVQAVQVVTAGNLVGVRQTPLPSPEPLTLRPRETALVEAAVLACPEIAAALTTRALALIEE